MSAELMLEAESGVPTFWVEFKGEGVNFDAFAEEVLDRLREDWK